MIYPLQNAIARNQVLAVACHMAIDRAMRRLHDGPERTGPDEHPFTNHLNRSVATWTFHKRMKTDESRCRWCGVAAAEARAELETEDGDE